MSSSLKIPSTLKTGILTVITLAGLVQVNTGDESSKFQRPMHVCKKESHTSHHFSRTLPSPFPWCFYNLKRSEKDISLRGDTEQSLALITLTVVSLQRLLLNKCKIFFIKAYRSINLWLWTKTFKDYLNFFSHQKILL